MYFTGKNFFQIKKCQISLQLKTDVFFYEEISSLGNEVCLVYRHAYFRSKLASLDGRSTMEGERLIPGEIPAINSLLGPGL